MCYTDNVDLYETSKLYGCIVSLQFRRCLCRNGVHKAISIRMNQYELTAGVKWSVSWALDATVSHPRFARATAWLQATTFHHGEQETLGAVVLALLVKLPYNL